MPDYVVLPTVYEPAEDSYMAVDVVKSIPTIARKKFLDMGCGSGIIGIEAALLHATVFSRDINPKAIENAKLNAKRRGVKIKAKICDLFKGMDSKLKFDIIFFNAPYLPGEPKDMRDRAWNGGIDGREVIERFLEEAPKHLNKNGTIYLVQSSHSNIKKTLKWAKNNKFSAKIVSERSFFFEKVVVIEFGISP